MSATPLSHRFTRAGLAFMLLSALAVTSLQAAPADAASVDCSRGTNLSFETPLVRSNPMGPAPNWALHAEGAVPGWDTSASDNQMEFWEDTFLGVPSHTGDQLAEINATQPGILRQTIATLEGDEIAWRIAHRGRDNQDTAHVRLGAPGSAVLQQVMATDPGSWVLYSGTYTVPAGQPDTRFSLRAIDSGSVGNLIDSVELSLTCEITMTSSVQTNADGDGSGSVSLGDVLTIEYVVRNEGTATLASVTVSDGLGMTISCPWTTLQPGQGTGCTGDYTVTQADVDAASVASDATASGTDAAGVTVSDGATLDIPVPQNPGISLTKTAAMDQTVVAPDGRVDVNDKITYSFEVTNTGNVTLDPWSVTDNLATPTCPAGALAPGATETCTAIYDVAQADIDTGLVTNSASAAGTPPSGPDTTAGDTVNTPISQMTGLSTGKTALDTTYNAVGDVLDYNLSVSNVGNVTLTNVTITDPNADGGSISCNQALPATLTPGESLLCTARHTVTQGDLDSGSVTNTANGSGEDPNGTTATLDSPTRVVNATQTPAVSVTKSAVVDETVVAPFDRTDVGDEIEYEFEVSNDGNVTLDSISVDDPLTGAVSCSPGALAPGDSTICSATYTATQSDIDSGAVDNTATATATPPAGPDVEATDSITTNLVQDPVVGLAKELVDVETNGDGAFTITYGFTVGNYGNTTLDNVAIDDDLDAAFAGADVTVIAATSSDFSVNPGFDGSADTALLDGTDSLSPGSFGSVALTIIVDPEGDAGPFDNSGAASGEGGGSTVVDVSTEGTDPDPDGDGDPTNNVGATPVTFDVGYDLTLSKTGDTGVAPGGTQTWVVTVSNNGPSVAPGPITVTDVLDTRLTYISSSGAGWICSATGQTVTCSHDEDLAAGDSSAVSIASDVDAEQGDVISNSASTSAANPTNETDSSNNVDSAAVTVEELPSTGFELSRFTQVGLILLLLGLGLVSLGRRRRLATPHGSEIG